MSSYEVFFGGPDLPAYRLRDLLAERVSIVPAGGAINWVTYYFCDQQLAGELVRAHRRGVKVTVTLESHPRTEDANKAVIAILSGPNGLGAGFRALSPRFLPEIPVIGRKAHLHEKLYCFSHPQTTAFVGSFNPSGNGVDDDPAVIREIGDQDRGDNVLVGIHDPLLVKGLFEHAGRIHRRQFIQTFRFSASANRTMKGKDMDIFFWPRIRLHPVAQFLLRLGTGARIRIVASHIKGASVIKTLIRIAGTGADMEILAGPTLRRVPLLAERKLRQAGISFRRVYHVQDLPMHNKFVLAEKGGLRKVIFGSFNWTDRSYWQNHEIGAVSANKQLFDVFAERWETLTALGD